jgi:hypothetical protein
VPLPAFPAAFYPPFGAGVLRLLLGVAVLFGSVVPCLDFCWLLCVSLYAPHAGGRNDIIMVLVDGLKNFWHFRRHFVRYAVAGFVYLLTRIPQDI